MCGRAGGTWRFRVRDARVGVSCIVERMTAVEVRDLRKRYRRGDTEVTALDGIDLTLAAGTFVAVVGPSGCGKSTLLHLCGGMDRPTAGEVRLDGRSLTALDDDELTRVRRERVGFVFQFFNLLPTLTVGREHRASRCCSPVVIPPSR